MTSSPFVLMPLECFLEIFIYINELRQRYGRGRIKGFKGLKVPEICFSQTSNPLNPFILSGGLRLVGSSGAVKGGGNSMKCWCVDGSQMMRGSSPEVPDKGNANPAQTLVTETLLRGLYGN